METKEGIQEHYAWYLNIILPVITLQTRDGKASLKQRTVLLNSRMETIENGHIDQVISEACAIQHKMNRKKRRVRTKNINKHNWTSSIRAAVQQGEMNRAVRR